MDKTAEKPVNRKHGERDRMSEYLRASTFSKLRENEECAEEDKRKKYKG